MNLIRWQPFQEVELLQRDINGLFDYFSTNDSRGERLDFTPAAELKETPEAIHLSLELPGMETKDIDIQVGADVVSVSGERTGKTQNDGQGKTRTEFRYGRFQRTISLPAQIQNTNVRTDYKDGILKLNLPKADQDKHKVVKVNLDSANMRAKLEETLNFSSDSDQAKSENLTAA